MVKWSHKRETAKLIYLRMKGETVQDYALNFLAIFNNAREYNNIIHRINNDSEDGVYVWCSEKNLNSVIDFLKQFGEIESIDNTTILWVDYHCTFEEYEEVFCETDQTIILPQC